jgi:hypothetical protein
MAKGKLRHIAISVPDKEKAWQPGFPYPVAGYQR